MNKEVLLASDPTWPQHNAFSQAPLELLSTVHYQNVLGIVFDKFDSFGVLCCWSARTGAGAQSNENQKKGELVIY
jgi:hypothetical protein